MDSRYWSADYELGIDEIDSQHRALGVAIDRFETAVADHDRWIVVHNALVELSNWAKFHFAVEESLMRIFNYPDLDAHAASHREFMERIRSFEEGTLRDGVADEVAGFLKDWLQGHICTADRRYAEFVRRRAQAA